MFDHENNPMADLNKEALADHGPENEITGLISDAAYDMTASPDANIDVCHLNAKNSNESERSPLIAPPDDAPDQSDHDDDAAGEPLDETCREGTMRPKKKPRLVTTTITVPRTRIRRVGQRAPARVIEAQPSSTSAESPPFGPTENSNDKGNTSSSPIKFKVHSKHDEKWNAMFEKLVAYHKEHDSTNVPQCYDQDPRLGRWVHYQRVEYWTFQSKGKAKITAERIARLEALGFAWDPQRAQWDVMYRRLLAFHKEYGHAKVPKGFDKDPELANWVRNQRLEYANMIKGRKTRMSPDRLQLLNELSFRWSNPSWHSKATSGSSSSPKQPNDQAPSNHISTGLDSKLPPKPSDPPGDNQQDHDRNADDEEDRLLD